MAARVAFDAADAVDDVLELGVDGRGVTDDPHAPARQAIRGQQALGSQNYRHFAIICVLSCV